MKFENIILNKPEDVVSFLKREDLINQLYEIEYTNNLTFSTKEKFIERLKENLYLETLNSKEMGVYFNLLHENKKIIGFSISNKEDKERAYIGRIAIRKEYQGKGLGKKLLINTVAKLRVKGFIYIDLTAKPALHKPLKQITGQSNIGKSRRKFNSDFKYSINNRKFNPESNEPITITIKKQKRKIPVYRPRIK
jgi:GNAT superfamily N-acetyltransferase